MKVFISWSGELSKAFAEELARWLPKVFPDLHPFVSSLDIDSGEIWLTRMAAELKDTAIGIICITRKNMDSNWIMFESGAIFKSLGEANIFPILINLSLSGFRLPLSAFQAIESTKPGFTKLIQGLAKVSSATMTEDELLQKLERHWPEIQTAKHRLLTDDFRERNGWDHIAEELLLPVIYSQVMKSEWDNIFTCFNSVRDQNGGRLDGEIGLAEASLSRLTGKRNACKSALQLAREPGIYREWALLEFLLAGFSVGMRLEEMPEEFEYKFKKTTQSAFSGNAIMALWHLRENRVNEAGDYFSRLRDVPIVRHQDDYYRAVPMGLLCFAFGQQKRGEAYFDLIKSTLQSNVGYPFIPLTADYDRAFVNACIGYDQNSEPAPGTRELKGHVWLLQKFAEIIIDDTLIKDGLIAMSKNWKNPLTPASIIQKMNNFKKKFGTEAGSPYFVTRELA